MIDDQSIVFAFLYLELSQTRSVLKRESKKNKKCYDLKFIKITNNQDCLILNDVSHEGKRYNTEISIQHFIKPICWYTAPHFNKEHKIK